MPNFYKRQDRIRKFYYNSMMKLYKEMLQSVTGHEDLLIMQKLVDEFSNSPQFKQYAEYLSKSVIEKVAVENAKDWREACFKSYRPNEFYKQLISNTSGNIQALINAKALENAQLISSMPALWSQQATKFITEEALKGRRAEEIKKDLLKNWSKMSDSRASLIARTEVSKTSTMLTQARSQAVGLNWYIWRTAEDARVRSSHDIMEGVVINYNDPPDPERLDGEKTQGKYNAGEIYNCRCYPEPIVDFADLPNSFKVYQNGQIVRMSKSQFKRVA